MTTPRSWTNAAWTNAVAEPFRSDEEFWFGLVASAATLVGLAVAVGFAALLALGGHPGWSAAPFTVPAALAIRAWTTSKSSSDRTRRAFSDRHAWRDAERTAVVAALASAARRVRRQR